MEVCAIMILSELNMTDLKKTMICQLITFFSWIVIIGSIVFELKFTDHDPDGRQILALVAFAILIVTEPMALFGNGNKTIAIVSLFLATIAIANLLLY